jgi:hypothetical protein
MIMTNVTAPGQPTRTYEIPAETSFLPVGDELPTDIVRTLNLKMDIPITPPDETYNFKIISSLGTIKTATITCKQATANCGVDGPAGPSGPSSLVAQLFLDGPTGVNSKLTTVIMFVTNNGDVDLTDVRPLMGNPTGPSGSGECDNMWQPFSVAPATQITDVDPCDLDSPVGVTLIPGQSVLFKWDGVIWGDVDDEVLFCNQARGVDPTFVDIDTAVVCDDLIVIDPNDCGGTNDCSGGDGEEDILDEKFITRPELFLTIPSPFGESQNGQPDRALWGANVVNPTDTTMYIHKITITAFPPASNDNFDVVEPGGTTGHLCAPQDISPGNGTVPAVGGGNAAAQRAEEAGFWSCPGSNTIMWRNYDNPITLPPQSTYPFMVKLAGKDPVSKNAESVLVDSTVYTTSGSFGKGNYQSTAYDKGMYANIYQVKDDGFGNPANPLDSDNWISSIKDIPSGSEQTFHVVLTDFDSDLSTYINATSKIVVNVPRAFTLVDTLGVNGTAWDKNPVNPQDWEPSITIHPDNTTQIIATLLENLGDDENEYVTLSFKGTAPTIAAGDNPKLMVMYTLANGLGTNNNSVGPLTEIILVVEPESP